MFKKRTNSTPRQRASLASRSATDSSYRYYTQHTARRPQEAHTTRLRPQASESSTRRALRQRRWTVWVGGVLVCIILAEITLLRPEGTIVVDMPVSTEAYQHTFTTLLKQNVLNYNKLTIDTNGLARQLRQAHPELETATITTPLFGTKPTAYIRVSEPAFVLKQGTVSYLLSRSGYVTGEVTTKSDLPVVIDETGETITLSKQLLPASHVTFMKTVRHQLSAQNMPVSQFVLPKGKAFEIDATIEGKTYMLKFNAVEDAVQQSGAAVAVIQQLGQTVPKEYIDLRVPGRAYYK